MTRSGLIKSLIGLLFTPIGLLLTSIAASTPLFLCRFAIDHHFTRLTPQVVRRGLFLSGQIHRTDIADLRNSGFGTIIDLRPDDEEPGQPTSTDLKDKVEFAKMAFHYLPVLHGEIPSDAVVSQLAEILPTAHTPVLLFCRTGNRALRTYALVLASTPGGPDQEEIRALGVQFEHSRSDLSEEIARRIAARPERAPIPIPKPAGATP